ncbi:MAG TPA: hypothetical protein VM840_10135, partial [Actinomycetota bacterium]|nr:hypothetical protein [Actinomycetota bacterium]
MTLKLMPGARSVPVARRAVDALAEDLSPEMAETVKILVTELVSPAVGGPQQESPVSLRLVRTGSTVRGEVTYPGACAPSDTG